ncbi:MAG: hypothetical protein CBC35_11990 [Planctomycetes bacterium TMED75]|nr:hypothetical protein [Planctomycetaceae bacterium]OUU90450.1 MAG: hypothetical protein CBC35_11990 [Planctomycetes bacterium TMED75]
MLHMFHCRLLAPLLLVSSLLIGCGSPNQLEGRVINAGFSGARFITQEVRDVHAIPGAGIPGASIELVRDPRSLGREVVARATSDHEGNFAMKVDAFGAGWMKEEWLFRCTHPGYPMVELFDSLPSLGGPTVLVIDMGGAPGGNRNQSGNEQDRIRREIERYGR